jgi:hypothetical protein
LLWCAGWLAGSLVRPAKERQTNIRIVLAFPSQLCIIVLVSNYQLPRGNNMKDLTVRSNTEMFGARISHSIDFDCHLVDHLSVDMCESGSHCSSDFYSWQKGKITINMSGLELKVSVNHAKKLLEALPEAIEEAEAPDED